MQKYEVSDSWKRGLTTSLTKEHLELNVNLNARNLVVVLVSDRRLRGDGDVGQAGPADTPPHARVDHATSQNSKNTKRTHGILNVSVMDSGPLAMGQGYLVFARTLQRSREPVMMPSTL